MRPPKRIFVRSESDDDTDYLVAAESLDDLGIDEETDYAVYERIKEGRARKKVEVIDIDEAA
jgi:hypothetical protein